MLVCTYRFVLIWHLSHKTNILTLSQSESSFIGEIFHTQGRSDVDVESIDNVTD